MAVQTECRAERARAMLRCSQPSTKPMAVQTECRAERAHAMLRCSQPSTKSMAVQTYWLYCESEGVSLLLLFRQWQPECASLIPP